MNGWVTRVTNAAGLLMRHNCNHLHALVHHRTAVLRLTFGALLVGGNTSGLSAPAREAAIRQLEAMGYQRQNAASALEAAKGNVQLAVELLTGS